MSNQYVGTWRIIEMEQGDQDFIDFVVPGYIPFRADHLGEFQFGAVHGDLDYRLEPHHDTESPSSLPSLNGSTMERKKSSSRPAGSLSVTPSIQGRWKSRLVGCTSTKMFTMRSSGKSWKRLSYE